jgi:hypothetical protein
MKIIALLAVALGLAACGSSDDTTGQGGSRTIPGPSDLQIAFTWSGGFVGRDDRLDIRPDGAARLTTRSGATRFQLSESELAKLRTLIEAADLPNVPPLKEPQGVADGFLYTITYDGHTITWGDGGQAPPAGVARLGSFLSELVELHSSP